MAINNQLLYKDDVGSVTIGGSKISSTFLSNNMIHLGGMGTILSPTSCTAGSYLNLSLNSYLHSSSDYKYIHGAESVLFQLYCGQALFRVAPTGVAGNTITYCEAMRVNNEGAVGIGNYGFSQNVRTNQFFISNTCSKAQIEGTDSGTSSLQLISNSTTEAPVLGLSRSRGTTIGSHTLVANNDNLGSVVFFASDGSSGFTQGAGVTGRINNICPAVTIASNQIPVDLVFSINDGGTDCGVSNVGRFSHAGNFLVGCNLACGNGMISALEKSGYGVLEARSLIDAGDGGSGVIVTRAVDCNSTSWAIGCHTAHSHKFHTSGSTIAMCLNESAKLCVVGEICSSTCIRANNCVIAPTVCGSTLMKGCVICGYRTGTGLVGGLRLERCDTVGAKTTCFLVSINPDNNCVVFYAACASQSGILCSAQTFRAPVMYTNDCFCTAGCVYAAGVVYSPNCLCSPVVRATSNLIPSGITCCNANIKTYTWPSILCGTTSSSCSYCYHLVRWSYDPFNWGNGGFMEFTLDEWYYHHRGGRKKYRVHSNGYTGGTGSAPQVVLVENTNRGGATEQFGIKVVGPTVVDNTAPGQEYFDVYLTTRHYTAIQVQLETNAQCTTSNPPENACIYICTGPTAQTDGTCFPICQIGSSSTECQCLGLAPFACGLEICGGTAQNLSRHDATLYVKASGGNDWGIFVDKPDGAFLQKWTNCSNSCAGLLFTSCDGSTTRTEFYSCSNGVTYSRVCFNSPIICGSNCVLAGSCVKSGIVCGGTAVCSPLVCGTGCIKSADCVIGLNVCMGSSWFRNANASSGLYNVANANHFSSTSACEWTICNNPNAVQLKLTGCKSAVGCVTTGYLYGEAGSCKFGLLNCAHEWAVQVCPNKHVYIICTTCSNISCGITCSISPIVCGSTCLKGAITCGVTCVVSPVLCASSVARAFGYCSFGVGCDSGAPARASGTGCNYLWGYQRGGTWAGNDYPDLVIGYHTGVEIGGLFTYGGTRFYNDHPNRTGTKLIFLVGCGNCNVCACYNLCAGGGVYSPIICATTTMQVGGNDVLTTASSVGANFCAGTDVNNRVVTANGASGSLCGEANLTFDGSTLNVTGAITASGDITSTSDERVKCNIAAICGAIQIVNNLCGRYFVKDGREQVGVVAQEIEKILPQVVFQHNEDNDIRSVSYGNIVGVLIEAIKEQNVNMCSLQNKITNLERLLGEE